MNKSASRRKTFQAVCFTAAFYLMLAVLFFILQVEGHFNTAKESRFIPPKAHSKQLLVRLQTGSSMRRGAVSKAVPATEQKTPSVLNAKPAPSIQNFHTNIPVTPQAVSQKDAHQTAFTSNYDNTIDQSAESSIHDTKITHTRAPYQDELDRKIKERLYYPERARKRNMEGTVSLQLTIDTAGNLQEFSMTGSSNHALLDKAALELIITIFPLHIKPSKTTISTVQIRYALIDTK